MTEYDVPNNIDVIIQSSVYLCTDLAFVDFEHAETKAT